MTVHNYSNTASTATLDSPLNSSANTFAVSSFTGYPNVPFFVLMDRDTSSSELMEVTNVAGSTLTVLRGVGGTASTSHSAGATVEHVIPAAVPQAVEQHIEATSNIHGVTGSLVGADSPGSMTNKTYEGAHVHRYSASLPASPAGGFVVEADNSIARDGFIANGSGANADRRGFLLKQTGSDRVEVFYDGTIKVTPSGASARPGIESTTSVRGQDLNATRDATVGRDLTVTGTATAAQVNAGNVNVSGNFNSTGTNTLGAITTNGLVTAGASGTGLAVTNNATVGGTVTAAGAVGVILSGSNGKLQFPSSASGNGTAAGQVRYRGGQVESWDGSSWRGTMAAPVATTGGFSGVTSTNNRVILSTAVTDPGYPYFLFVSGQAEFNDVDGATRWDLVICLDSASNSDYLATAVGNGFVQTSAVSNILTGNHTLFYVARRTLGSGSLNVTGFNQNFSVAQMAAVIRPT